MSLASYYLEGNVPSECSDFMKSKCPRLDCNRLHNYRICKDYQNRKCDDVNCNSMHLSITQEMQYRKSCHITPYIAAEAIRTLQLSVVCKRNIQGTCPLHEVACAYRHIRQSEFRECPVCKEILEEDKTGTFTECNHLLCSQCFHQIGSDDNSPHRKCPVCRTRSQFITLF